MLLSNQYLKVAMIFAVIHILLFHFAKEIMASVAMEMVRRSYNQLVVTLNSDQDEEFGELLSKWEGDLKEVSTYANRDFLDAIDELQTDYFTQIAKTEKCMVENEQYSKINYSSSWVRDLRSKFGKDYIKENKATILMNFKVIVMNLDHIYCGDLTEALLLKEAVLYGAYRYYFNTFLEFYNSESHESQMKLQPQKKKVDSFLSLIENSSMAKVLLGRGKPIKQLAEIDAKRQDMKLYSFFNEHPLSRFFDPQKASNDLDRAVK